MRKFHFISSALIFILAILTISADVVETKDGARLTGKLIQIDGTSVVLETVYAGTVKIKQSEVTSVATDTEANIRLISGTVLHGMIAGTGSGALVISGPDGSLHTSVDRILATWRSEAKDPLLIALERTWAYEATVDIVGKTGNSEQLSSGLTFRATLNGPLDKLQFYSAYDRQVIEGQKSADQFKAGADYQNSFSGRYSWYLRDELGFDRVKLIEFSNIAAVGLGYDVIKKPKHTLTARIGFAHRFESYNFDPVYYAELIDPQRVGGPVEDHDAAKRLATKENVDDAGLDIGLNHTLELKEFSVVNRLSYTPTFADYTDYHIEHESFLEMPLHNPMWKLRMGVTNEYISKPAQERRRLDTTYFTRLVLNWK